MMNRKSPFIEKLVWLFLFAGVVGFFLMVAYNMGKDSANPCLEYSDACIEYVSEYDDVVLKDCPCLKYKYD